MEGKPSANVAKGISLMKLDIIGSVASGKTTLARKLSAQYRVPFYEKDNIVWERTPDGDKRRNPEDRDQMFRQILARSIGLWKAHPGIFYRKALPVVITLFCWISIHLPDCFVYFADG